MTSGRKRGQELPGLHTRGVAYERSGADSTPDGWTRQMVKALKQSSRQSSQDVADFAGAGGGGVELEERLVMVPGLGAAAQFDQSVSDVQVGFFAARIERQRFVQPLQRVGVALHRKIEEAQIVGEHGIA